MSEQPGRVLPPGRRAPTPPVRPVHFGGDHGPSGSAAVRSSPRPRPRPRLRRPTQGRIVAGVALGLAEHLGLPVKVVRVGFVVATIATSGAGLLAYVLLWALTAQERSDGADGAGSADGAGWVSPRRPGRRPRPARPAAWGSSGAPGSLARTDASLLGGTPGGLLRERVQALVVGVLLMLAGLALLLTRAGLDLHARIWLPLLVLLIGAAIALRQLDISERARWLAPAGGSQRVGVLRLGGGVVLAVVGILLLVARGTRTRELVPIAVASLAVLVGVGLVLAPWGLRLWRDLERERALRVRELERAEIAAHLHDSVLQTLALIQRKPGDAAEVARLARAQERELRDWLYAGPPAGADLLQVAVREVVAEVEDAHGVPVELVVVGDRPVDEASRALVQALREALLNAVRHGRPPVAAYVESGPDGVTAFVRDRGEGFEPDDVPGDRLGVRESVIGRMHRHGGRAEVRRVTGGGTEVRLELPVETGDTAEVGPTGTAREAGSTFAPAPTTGQDGEADARRTGR